MSVLQRPSSVLQLLVLWCGVSVVAACGDESGSSVGELAPNTSALWGREGERWSPNGRLPDFSFAGYHGGDDPIPDVPVAANVRDFGAVGDGETDDSQAFLDAIDSIETGAVLIPEGRYRLTQVLRIEKSGVVLRGAGLDKTVLFFPLSLYELLGQGNDGGPLGWAWGGGWIWVDGSIEDTSTLARIVAPAERGDTWLELDDASPLQAGEIIRLTQTESNGSLTLELHGGHPLNGRCIVESAPHPIVDWAVEIAKVEGDRVQLNRPLRVAVRPEWQPDLRRYEPTVSEVGIEDLAIEFPLVEYPGHHNEPGYNAIHFWYVDNSWVRNVRITNFDNAIFFWYSKYSTGRDLLLDGRGGHYGLSLGGSQDCLMTDFKIVNRSFHDLSVSNLANGNVFSRGSGKNINFDHHRGAAYENLFTDIDVGKAWKKRRVWACSGTPSGHYTAARETFWNIRPQLSPQWIPAWPQMNIIGPFQDLETQPSLELEQHIEPIKELEPANLHAAQLERRSRMSLVQ